MAATEAPGPTHTGEESSVYRNDGDADSTTVLGDEESPSDSTTEAIPKTPWRKALEKAIKSNKFGPSGFSSLPYGWTDRLQIGAICWVASAICWVFAFGGLLAAWERTVVFRGFVEGSDFLYIVTDSRSKKVDEIAANPWAEIAWYFTITREQFRIRGKLRVIGPEYKGDVEGGGADLSALRVAAWRSMSDAARNGFAWPQPGDTPPAPAEVMQSASAPADAPLATFSIVVMEPTHIDHLILKGNPQRRTLHARSGAGGSWVATPCNP